VLHKDTPISTIPVATEKLYGGPDLPNRIENQPKLIKYFEDEKVALQSLLQLEALLYEEALLLRNAHERNTQLIQDIEDLAKIINNKREE